MKLLIIFSIILVSFINWSFAGDEFEDYRCRCACPPLTVVEGAPVNASLRRVYIDVVKPEFCRCRDVVFKNLTASDDFIGKFCPRCACNYEVRNTTTMKVVVIIIMVSISLLFIYMSFLLCLDPMMNPNSKSTATTAAAAAAATATTTRSSKAYQRQINDDVQVDNPTQECFFSEPMSVQQNRQRSSTVLDIVTHGQSKWRKQVHQQRQSVYNRHDLLN